MKKYMPAWLLTALLFTLSCRSEHPRIEMVEIESGTFVMGSDEQVADHDEKPLHEVRIEAFRIGRYEVTQRQWTAVTGSNPSFFKGDDRPVECVSWQEVQKFIDKLNRQTGRRFRLPTEAEWEYAARGGCDNDAYTYAGSNDIGSVAWFAENSDDRTHDVGGKLPNRLGLYDMSGNVNEWCDDSYDSLAYTRLSNAAAAASGEAISGERVFRGGGWYSMPCHVRTANRNHASAEIRDRSLGFRLAEDID